MLLIDDLLLAPYRGIKWIFKEVHRLAEEELQQERESITEQLSELYRMLELGEIDETEFDEQEETLLNRLDEIEEESAMIGDELPEEELEEEEIH